MERANVYLITGASGFIGRHLVDELSKRKEYQIRCLVTSDRYSRRFCCYPNVGIFMGNLLDRESLEKAIAGVDTCIHLASIMNSKDKDEFERVNVQGMANLVEVSRRHNIGKFVYVSSIDAEVNPSSLYGQSKLAAEKILKNSSLKFTILRPSVVYGAYDNKNISSLVNLVKRSPFIPVIGDGEYRRQPLYVGDLIYVIERCIELEHTNGKTYNVGGPSALSMNAILETIQMVLSKNRLTIYLPTNRIKALYSLFGKWSKVFRNHIQQVLSIDKDKLFDITTTQRELDFNPVEFEDGLRIMFEELNKEV